MVKTKTHIFFIINTVLSVFLLSFSDAAPKNWPSHFPRCSRNDPNLNQCILEATETMRPYLKEGIAVFDIPPISPFHVPEVNIDQGGQNDSIRFKLAMKNLTITGFDTYKFNKFEFDVQNMKFHADLNLGLLRLDTFYNTDGKILAVPIEGEGKLGFKILTSNGTLNQNVRLNRKKYKNKSYNYIIGDLPDIKIQVGKIEDTYYSGLFQGNEVLAKAADNIFTEYQSEIFEEIKPAVEKVIAEIILDLQKKIWNKVPYDELYPADIKTI